MALGLLKFGFRKGRAPAREIPPTPDLAPTYDVAIIGAGGHGLAAAYYLARDWGVRRIAVVDKGYLGGGNTARNTAIIRANYLTPESVVFYKESLFLFRGLSEELGFNIMMSERGHLTLGHTDAEMRTMRWRAEVNKQCGVDSEVVHHDTLRRLAPALNLDDSVRLPIMGALYHPPGSIARHDAVAWGYAIAASRLGVEIHQGTEITKILQDSGRAVGFETSRGTVHCGTIIQAVAGNSSRLAALAGFRLPIRTIPLQACVSEPLKPILDPIVVSAGLHAYVSQSARGELVMGGAVDPYPLYASRSTLDFKEHLMAEMLELFPAFANAHLLRQWAGIADMTPDFSPVMGVTPLGNYFIDAGWGTWGFKATPVCGKRMAETAATGRVPSILKPFALDRFTRFEQLGERGAAAVGH